jgi:FkbM family methyltransferase
MESSTLKKLEDEYKKGCIGKQEYIQKMHDLHKTLFEYGEFLKTKDIKRIEIEDGAVIMITKENDIRLICDKDDVRIIPIEILNFDFYEKEELKIILELIKDCSCVFDIGANIGWYSINVAKRKKDVSIYSFEPIPKTYSYLVKNLENNNACNVQPFNFGFSDEEKEVVFYYYPEGSGNASSSDLTGRKDVERITCKVNTIDNFVSANGLHLDFIKCDVEGAELFVFKGGINAIKNDKPIIFTEMLRKWSSKFNYHPNEIIQLLTGVGYGCYVINNGYLVEFHKMNDTTAETNFLFLHPERHGGIIKKYVVTLDE